MFKRVASLLDDSKLAQVQLWLDSDSVSENEFVLDLSDSFKMNKQVGRDLGREDEFRY